MVAVCRLEGTGLGDTVGSLLDKVQLTVPFVKHIKKSLNEILYRPPP